jgi:hypothetical protein
VSDFAFHIQIARDAIERVESHLSAIPNNPNPALRGPMAFGYVRQWLRAARANVDEAAKIVAAEMANAAIARHWRRKVIPALRRHHSMPIAQRKGES